MLVEAAESKKTALKASPCEDLRFTLTFRLLASQQRNYRARGVVVPAVEGLSL